MKWAGIILAVTVMLLVSSEMALGFKKGEKGKSKQKQELQGTLKKEEDIKVQIVHKPDNCETKTRYGDKLTVHYTGSFQNGQVFDSSRDKQPFTFQLGAGQVIPGWERGLVGMCEGEKRILIVPPNYAYGEAGHPPVIPPSTTITFEVDLIKIEGLPDMEAEQEE